MRTLLRAAVAGLALTVVMFGVSIEATAQSFQGGLRGAVRDNQEVIPGATVTLTNEGGQVTAQGNYSRTLQVTARYSVLFPGFQSSKVPGFLLDDNSHVLIASVFSEVRRGRE
jgi:hypothetical protein